MRRGGLAVDQEDKLGFSGVIVVVVVAVLQGRTKIKIFQNDEIYLPWRVNFVFYC